MAPEGERLAIQEVLTLFLWTILKILLVFILEKKEFCDQISSGNAMFFLSWQFIINTNFPQGVLSEEPCLAMLNLEFFKHIWPQNTH